MSSPGGGSGIQPFASAPNGEVPDPRDLGSPPAPAPGSAALDAQARTSLPHHVGGPYRPDIDGLRALAVLAVLAFHAEHGLLPGGFTGVDVFFVISGYLISGIIFRELAAGSFTLGGFYARRIRRIFPALAVVLLAALVLGWFYLLPEELVLLGRHVAASVGFVQNWLLWREVGYFDPAATTKPLLHLWSLGVEEQFYLIYPCLIALLSRRRRTNLLAVIAGIGLASFGLGLLTLRWSAEAAYFLPHSRFWELMAGAAIAVPRTAPAPELPGGLRRRNAQAFVGLALIVTGLIAIAETFSFPGWWACLPVGGAALLISAGPLAWVNRRVLSNPLLVAVGLISYPLYLWHWVLLTFLRIREPSGPAPLHIALALAASFVAAGLTYRLVERPIRGQHTWLARPAPLLALLAGVGGLGLVVVASHGLPRRFPEQIAAVAASLQYDPLVGAKSPECWLSRRSAPDAFASSCVDPPDPQQREPLIFVWGDSHAARLTAGMRALQATRAFRLAQFTRDSCRPMLGVEPSPCEQGNQFVLGELARTKPDVIVLFANWTGKGKLSKLNATLAAIQAISSQPVFVIGPAPQWEPSLPRSIVQYYERFGTAPDRMTLGLLPGVADADRRLREQLRDSGVTYVSAWQVFCDAEGCLTRTDSDPHSLVSWDYGHLTTSGAAYLLVHGLPDALWGRRR
jgi:peptidoglycan/LPS O-acetylase OafA/YrhL